MQVLEVICPVTDAPVAEPELCLNCKYGLWMACPIQQEIAEAAEAQEAT